MSELRLVPAAGAVWLAALVCLWQGPVWAACVVAAFVVACLLWREFGQAVLVGSLGLASLVVALVRHRIAQAWQFGDTVVATVSGQPRLLASDTWLTRVVVPGHPSTLAVFSREMPEGVVSGTVVAAHGTVGESKLVGVNPYVFNGTLEVVEAPSGFAAFAQHVRETFAASVVHTVGSSSQGLIPGMVLGDTSLQTPTEQQAYIDTGLSHLSAVSGSNVAIVTTAAIVLTTLLGLSLHWRLVAAGAALLVFAALVGPEPSVLRASVTGLVGMVAVLTSTRAEPMHVLCLAVIGLVFVDTDLAVHYGFALSVAATAGIVALSPLLYRALAFTRWPDIVVRALSVAIAADVVTMPIVSVMAGQVSLVSTVANTLVSPATAPVTILGLCAAVLALLPGGLEVPLLLIVQPFTWWVNKVAVVGASLPLATAPIGPLAAIVGYGWIIYGFLAGRPRLTVALAVVTLCVSNLAPPRAPVVDQHQLVAHVVDTRADVEPVPPGTQLVVVLEDGPPTTRGTKTVGGIPVVFPNRDGPVTLRTDASRSP